MATLDLDHRLACAREQAEILRAEMRIRLEDLARERQLFADQFLMLKAEIRAFEGRIAAVIGIVDPVDRGELLKAVEQRVAASDGEMQHRVRGVVEGLGHNYLMFLQLMECHMGERDTGAQLMQQVLANLMGPVVQSSTPKLRPIVRARAAHARPGRVKQG